jgi:hypothetical protein
MRGESRPTTRLLYILWLAVSFASTAIAQGAATKPVVRPFFDGTARAAVFLVECGNPSGTPVDRFDNRWTRNYRIDGVEPAPHGYAGSISGGPFAPIAADGLWRGTVELVQPNGVSRNSTEADGALGVLADVAIAYVLTPGRHTIAVQCFDTWSDDLAFSWPPPEVQDATSGPSLTIQLPHDIRPERTAIFYSLASTGLLNDRIVTKPGVFDYSIETGSHAMKLLIFIPGYRIVTADFTDAQVRSVGRFPPSLVRSEAILNGRLVDSTGQPLSHHRLTIGYDFDLIGYFCGNCGFDGPIQPPVPIGEMRTDDDGAFSFAVPSADDPFFRAHRGGALVLLSESARGPHDSFDDTLRPSRIAVQSVTAEPLLVTHIARGVLSGRLGKEFLRQQGLDLSSYRLSTSPPDSRGQIQLDASWKNGSSSGSRNTMLKADGLFEVSLSPGTYDLELSVLDAGGTLQHRILVSKGLVIRENQRTVVERP